MTIAPRHRVAAILALLLGMLFLLAACATATPYPYYDDPFYDTRTVTRIVERFEAHAEIEMLRAPLDDRKYGVFDARRLVNDMGPTIEYPKD